MSLLFFMLCVSFSAGGENCDYEWTVINNSEEWEYLHSLYDVRTPLPLTNGFTVSSEKKVFVLSDFHTARTIAHEARHVICYLEEPLDQRCHVDLDRDNIMINFKNNQNNE